MRGMMSNGFLYRSSMTSLFNAVSFDHVAVFILIPQSLNTNASRSGIRVMAPGRVVKAKRRNSRRRSPLKPFRNCATPCAA
ncbi:hypothetical protein D3C85_1089510 [compost metagenome]